MAILNNVSIFYLKADPTKPSSKVTPDNPRWEMQARTTDKAQKKEWEALGIKVKVVDPDEGELYYKTTFTKNAFKKVKKDGVEVLESTKPVEIVDGELNPIDPNTIGNGSVGNVRLFLSDYSFEKEGKTFSGVKATLMGIQITTHKVYTPKPQESFGATGKTERIEEKKDEDADPDDSDDGGFTKKEHAEDPNKSTEAPVNPKPAAQF